MSHVLAYKGQYFRVLVAEVVNADDPAKSGFVAWCSDSFRNLEELPRQELTRFVAGPPQATATDALRHADEWIKRSFSAPVTEPTEPARVATGITYTAWLFKGEKPTGFEFAEFFDAKAFAAAAEKSSEITKIGITNNESPQYLTMWQRK
jgi:hypothetical protein